MIKIIFKFIFLAVLAIGVNSCKPDSTPPTTSGDTLTVTELADLVKTPDQVIPWRSAETDSVWIVYTDVKWESIKITDKTKRNLDFGSISTFRFTVFAGNESNIFISSPADIVFHFDLTAKSYDKILNTITVTQPQTNPNTLHFSTDSTFLVKGYKPFKWNGTQFVALPASAPYNFVMDFMKVGNSYFWYSRDKDNASLYYLTKSNLSLSDIKKVNEGTLGSLVFHSNDNIDYGLIVSGSSITGYVFDGSTVISNVNSFSAPKLKEFKKTAYYLLDGSLYKLSISPVNGTLTGTIIINKSDLDNQTILNYWIYGGQYYLYLSNNKLVSVKI